MKTSASYRLPSYNLAASIVLAFLGSVSLSLAAAAQTGSIAVQVTDATPSPLANVNVQIVDSTYNHVVMAPTNASGQVIFPGLAPGTYFARTHNALGFIDELYDGVYALANDYTGATAINVTDGNTTNIAFSLDVGGLISGQITDVATTNGIANVRVDVWDASGRLVGSTNLTTGTGNYITHFGLAAGNYFAATHNDTGYYVDMAYDGQPFNSPMSTWMPINVVAGQTHANVNFQLTEGGRISGTVRGADTMLGIPNIELAIFDNGGQPAAGLRADGNGYYETPALLPGTYYVMTGGYGPYIRTVYPNSFCTICDARIGTPISVTAGTTATDKDFLLVVGGQISGVVIDETTLAPLANVRISVADASGQFVINWDHLTGSDGVYTTIGLPAGTYYIRTEGSHDYVNEFYNNLPYTTDPLNATAVTVSLGLVTGNINFQLSQGGRISGKVSDAVTLLGLGGAPVSFFDTSGNWVAFAGADPSGNYLSPALAPGTYYAKTDRYGLYIQQLYGGSYCLNCDVTTGTGITVTSGNTTPNINLSLTIGGWITGQVTKAMGGMAIQGVPLQVAEANGQFIWGSELPTDANGAYSTVGLPAGTYYIRTTGFHAFVNEFYDNLSYNTPPTSATPVTVTLGNETPNIDFQLADAGHIGGVVNADGGGAIAGACVVFYDSGGQWANGTCANMFGEYSSPPLAAGSYFVVAESPNFVTELYNNIPCINCAVTLGTPVTVTEGATTTVNFSLALGGRFTGRVTNANGGAGLGGISVEIYDGLWTFLGSTTTSPDGSYMTLGLPTGNYYARTVNNGTFIDQAYQNLPTTTPFSSWTPIGVVGGGLTSDIDFQLAEGGRISGRVVDVDLFPVIGIGVSVFNSLGNYVGTTQTGSGGNYQSGGLPAGTYYAKTDRFGAYIQELYGGAHFLYGSVTAGTPISVTSGATTVDRDFVLDVGGQISGHVTNEAGGAPISNVPVEVADSTGQFLSGWEEPTDATGAYITTGLPAGTYYIRTPGGYHEFVNEFYNNLPYGTNTTSATPVTVALGSVTQNIDFQLGAGGFISGTVRGPSGNPIAAAYVSFRDGTGRIEGVTRTNALGVYVSPGLAAGSHYVRIDGASGYVPEAYDNIICYQCSGTTGTTVAVTVSATTENIDFSLEPSVQISGTITSEATGLGVANAWLEVFSETGQKLAQSVGTGPSGLYVLDLPAGTYYLRTRNYSGYTNEVYNDLPIWTAVTSGTAITVTSSTTVDFALAVNTGPNTSDTAVEVPIGLTENLVFTEGQAPDIVWYKFFVPEADAGKDLKVNLRVTSPYPNPIPAGWASDLDFEILDSALNVRALAVSGSDDETLYLHNVASGWYYVYMGSTIAYADTDLAARYSINIELGTTFGIGYITGRVLDNHGVGVAQAYVRAHPVPGNHSVSFPTVTAGPGGYFTVPALPGYRALWFGGGAAESTHQAAINIVEEFYSDKPSVTEVDPIVVTDGDTTDVGDVTVQIGAIVSGHVTNATDAPLANVFVFPFTTDAVGKGLSSTDATGAYTLTGVPVGGAKVRFNRGQHANEYFNDQPTMGTATVLATEEGVTIANVDAVLTAGGKVTGTVQNNLAQPIAANVRIYSVLDGTYSRASVTSSATTGAFTFNNVKPGQYKIQFAMSSIGFAEEWYDNGSSFADAAVITVTEGGTVSGITAQLAPTSSEMDVTRGSTPVPSSDTHAFGPHMLNTDTDVTLTITNTGTGGLTISGLPLTMSGPDAYQFSVVANPVATLLASGSTTVTVRFRPTTAGPKTAYLSIPNNDGDENPYVINFSGTGITSQLTPVITWLDPAPIVFGTPLGPLQLNATADVPGTFTYTPDSGTVLAVGTHTLSVLFTPTDTVTYTTASDTASLTVLTAGAVRSDFTGDGKRDVLWRHTTYGEMWQWPMDGATRTAETYVRTIDPQWAIRGLGDQTGDGKADIVWRHQTSGTIYFWPMDGSTVQAETYVGTVDPGYDIVATGDFNGDARSDLLWRHTVNGEVWLWPMDGGTRLGELYVGTVDPAYAVVASGDLDGDGKADIVWHHGTIGEVWVWLMDGATVRSQTWVATVPDVGYRIVGVADHSGDGKADILWRHDTAGEVWLWSMDGATRLAETSVGTVSDTNYRIVSTGDYSGDGKADLLWHHATAGEVWVWLMDGATRLSETWVATVSDVGYQVIAGK